MLEKATLLVSSYDAMVFIAIAMTGIATATAWTVAKRSHATATQKKD